MGKATSIAWSRSMPSEHAYPLTIDNLAKAPGMGVKGTSEEAFLASEISTKNNGWVGWVRRRWGDEATTGSAPCSGCIDQRQCFGPAARAAPPEGWRLPAWLLLLR